MIGSHIADRYRLDAEIGRGGMGAVYRAYDTTLHRDVAIKLLSATGLGTEGKARLMNEARAVASLNHPNIVAIFDAGESPSENGIGDPIPYIVMELLDGQTLHDRPPESLGETLELTRQLCSALGHAHDNDIIHRDLKPENVMLVGEASVKLMDFGLARSLTTRVTTEGTVIGTLFYMAPEMIMGQEVDGRVDLYALGIMLYEMTAKRLPFEADDPVAVLTQHLHAPTVPPSTHNPELSPGIDRLIVSLMAKEPEGRPISAAAVLAALDGLERPQVLAEESRSMSTLDRIVRGRLIGRSQEMVEAQTMWNQTVAAQGQLLLVSGEPGVGKTRLVEELVTQAHVSGGRVLSGASYAEGGSPYAPFRMILRDALNDDVLTDVFDIPDDVLADLLTLVPEYRARYPELPDMNPGDPQVERQRLLDNIAHYFNLLSSRAPLLLVIEDAHWADSGTISLMLHLARSCTRQRLMMAITYREVEIVEARALHRALLDLQRERRAARIKLSRLDKEGTRELMATLFDEEITPEFLEGFYRETEGNPFFIEEIAKALVESGQLTFEDGRWHHPPIEELGIPQSIQVAVQTRASALSELSQKILEQAAVLGRVFDLPALELATEQDEDSLVDALEEALVAQLIEEVTGSEDRGAGSRFSFVHALVPASLVEGLRALQRRRLQRRAAIAFESLRPDDFEVLAYHFIEAGQLDKGIHYLLQAGDRARVQYAHEEAIESYRAAIDYLKEKGQLEKAAHTLMKLGLAYNNAFEFAQSRQAYQEGFALWQQTNVSPSAESAQPAPHALRLRMREPKTLDPGFQNGLEMDYIQQLFCGLVQMTVEMDIVPDVAQSWEVMGEGRRYRFHLRDDVYWSDGVQVTAKDFAFAWRRVLTPQYDSENARAFFTIKNGHAYHREQSADWDEVGVRILDPLSIEVELERPDSTFLYVLSFPFTFALPQHQALKSGIDGPDAPWMSWDRLVTNGPFRLEVWENGQRLSFKANPTYHGRRSGNLEGVEIIFPGSDKDEGRLSLYEKDLLDEVSLAAAHAVQARNRFAADHVSYPFLSTSYYYFDTTREPFKDPRVRRALTLATDRERLSESLHQGLTFPATGGFVPPGMPGHTAGIALPFDPEQARRLLSEAGYGEKGSFPLAKLLTGGYVGIMNGEFLTEQWRDLLGISIEIEEIDVRTYTGLSQRDPALPPALSLGGWSADYPDADNFLRLGSFRGTSGWRHEGYERLIRQAREMTDQSRRLALYRQAEQILVEEAPLVPFAYTRRSLLIKPWVRRFPTSPISEVFWKDVVIEPH